MRRFLIPQIFAGCLLILVSYAEASTLDPCESHLVDMAEVMATLVLRAAEVGLISSESVAQLADESLDLNKIRWPSASPETLALQQAIRRYSGSLTTEHAPTFQRLLREWLVNHHSQLEQQKAAHEKTKGVLRIEHLLLDDILPPNEGSFVYSYYDSADEPWIGILSRVTGAVTEVNLVSWARHSVQLEKGLELERSPRRTTHLINQVAFPASNDRVDDPYVVSLTHKWHVRIPISELYKDGPPEIRKVEIHESPDGNLYSFVTFSSSLGKVAAVVYKISPKGEIERSMGPIEDWDQRSAAFILAGDDPAIGLVNKDSKKWCVYRANKMPPTCWRVPRSANSFQFHSDRFGNLFTSYMNSRHRITVVGQREGRKVTDTMVLPPFPGHDSLWEWRDDRLRMITSTFDGKSHITVTDWNIFSMRPARQKIVKWNQPINGTWGQQLFRDSQDRLWLSWQAKDIGTLFIAVDGDTSVIQVSTKSLQEIVDKYPVSTAYPQTIELAPGVSFSFADILYHLPIDDIGFEDDKQRFWKIHSIHESEKGLTQMSSTLSGFGLPTGLVITDFVQRVEENP